MRWRPFYLAQLKLALAQPFALAFVVLALTFSLALGLIAQNKTDRQLTVAFVLEDSNQLANRLVALTARQETLDVVVMSRQAAFKALNQDKLEAVFVVTERFSEQIAQGAYRRLVERYTSPSARYTAMVSEPVIASAMLLWAESRLLQQTERALNELDLAYSDAIRDDHIRRMDAVWINDTTIRISEIVQDVALPPDSQTEPERGPLAQVLGWYAALCVFYLMACPAWILDLKRPSLAERVAQLNVRGWQILLLASLAPVTICLAGGLLAGTGAGLFLYAGLFRVIAALPALLVFLLATVGQMLVLARWMRQTLLFLFAAPLVTFVQAVLSGLLLPLPPWAGLLKQLALLLPGSHLAALLTASPGMMSAAAWLGLLLSMLGWLGLGILLNSRAMVQVTRTR